VTKNDAFPATGGEQNTWVQWHCGIVKNEVVNDKSALLTKPTMARILVVVCGFWVSQSMACYFFSGSLMSGTPSLSGPLSVSVFALFLILHFFRPCSKLAAILGLCSLGVFAGYIAYVNSPIFTRHVSSPIPFLVLSFVLAFVGLVTDEERCRRMVVKATENCRLKLAGAPKPTPQPQPISQRHDFNVFNIP
jgi:hypothetical protein